MRVDVRGQGVEITKHRVERSRRRVHATLSRYSNRIARATVRYATINGPRGGIDKRCRIVIESHDLGVLVVEAVEEHLEAALARAADRAGRAVTRARDRARLKRTNRRVQPPIWLPQPGF